MTICLDTCARPTPAQCHCATEQSAEFALSAWNGDPGFLANRYTHLDECPVDGCGVLGQALADLVSALPSGVQARRPDPPPGVTMDHRMLLHGRWSQVLWAVVGPQSVDVVNVILGRDPASEDSVLVGFDVLPRPDAPAEQDVAVRSDVSARLVLRNLLAGTKRASDPKPVVRAAASVASTPLPGALNRRTAVDANDEWHGPILAVTALCHRTFGGITGFDAHRRNGVCIEPKGYVEVKGIWRQPAPDRPYWEAS